MLAGLFRGPGRELVAWDSALLYDMIYTQPVVHEFSQLQTPTLLLIGQLDTTAIGKDLAPPAVAARLGHYPVLGRRAAKRIPHARLVEFPTLGQAPQIQDPDLPQGAAGRAGQPLAELARTPPGALYPARVIVR
jgi:pimeloyl-ACP methyl ester carboxylesterase